MKLTWQRQKARTTITVNTQQTTGGHCACGPQECMLLAGKRWPLNLIGKVIRTRTGSTGRSRVGQMQKGSAKQWRTKDQKVTATNWLMKKAHGCTTSIRCSNRSANCGIYSIPFLYCQPFFSSFFFVFFSLCSFCRNLLCVNICVSAARTMRTISRGH